MADSDISENNSLFITCIICDRTIAFLAMKNNIRNNWDGLKHISDCILALTVCKSCEYKFNTEYINNIYKQYKSMSYIVSKHILHKCKNAITGCVTILKENNNIKIYNRYSLLNMTPDKYIVALINKAKSWPINKIAPGDFL